MMKTISEINEILRHEMKIKIPVKLEKNDNTQIDCTKIKKSIEKLEQHAM